MLVHLKRHLSLMSFQLTCLNWPYLVLHHGPSLDYQILQLEYHWQHKLCCKSHETVHLSFSGTCYLLVPLQTGMICTCSCQMEKRM